MEEGKPISEEWSEFPGLSQSQKAFLTAYVRCGTVTKAAEFCGINRRTTQYWKAGDDNDTYRKAFVEAEERFIQTLESELYRRATSGVMDQHSATLLIFTLKAKRPHIYRDRYLVETQPGAEVSGMNLDKLSDEDLAAIKVILGKMGPQT